MIVSPEGAPIKDVKELKGKKLIVNKGTTAEIYFTKNHPDIELLKYDQNTETFNALLDKRGAALAHDNTLVFAALRPGLPGHDRVAAGPVGTDPAGRRELLLGGAVLPGAGRNGDVAHGSAHDGDPGARCRLAGSSGRLPTRRRGPGYSPLRGLRAHHAGCR